MSAARSFRSTPFGAPGINPQSLGIPAAAYPGRIATNSDLIVAVDRQQTTLLLPVTASATSMTVLDPSMMAAYSLLSIDNEIVKTTGPPAGNVVPISRGFDGTTPAIHLANALVSGLVDAYHHNGLVAEIEAIETALGVNLSHVTGGQVPFLVSSTFKFPPQSPGGTLVTGNNPITLSPVPAGVNGTDQGHYLYVSGGTGTAEPVLITGGSAVSGAASGTLIINCANAHSGAWTIQSATAGIQEALASQATSHIYIPAGTWTIYGTITVPANSSYRISGAGQHVAILSTSYTGGPIFSLNSVTNTILEDFEIDGPSSGTNYALTLWGAWNSRFERIRVTNVANGFNLTGSMAMNAYRDIEVNLSVVGGIGFSINGGGGGEAGGTFDRVFITGNIDQTHGFDIVSGVGALFRDCYTNGILYGLYIHPGNGQKVQIIDLERAYFDGYSTLTTSNGIGINISPQVGSTVSDIRSIHSGAGGFDIGIAITGTGLQDVIFRDAIVFGNTADGILVSPTAGITKNLAFIDCWLEDNNGSKNGSSGGATISGVTDLTIRGGYYGAGSAATNTQNWGIRLGNCTNALVTGAVLTPNIAGPISVTACTGVVIKDCVGYNPIGQVSITVGASPFTYTAGTTPETVYVQGGVVTFITLGGRTILNSPYPAGQSAIIPLAANESIAVTYTTVPTMFRDVQ